MPSRPALDQSVPVGRSAWLTPHEDSGILAEPSTPRTNIAPMWMEQRQADRVDDRVRGKLVPRHWDAVAGPTGLLREQITGPDGRRTAAVAGWSGRRGRSTTSLAAGRHRLARSLAP